MAKAKRRGDLDGYRRIGTRMARSIHRQLRKSGKVRRSFKRWFRCEAEGIEPRVFRGKVATLACS